LEVTISTCLDDDAPVPSQTGGAVDVHSAENVMVRVAVCVPSGVGEYLTEILQLPAPGPSVEQGLSSPPVVTENSSEPVLALIRTSTPGVLLSFPAVSGVITCILRGVSPGKNVSLSNDVPVKWSPRDGTETFMELPPEPPEERRSVEPPPPPSDEGVAA
jgi:hypothetical protein